MLTDKLTVSSHIIVIYAFMYIYTLIYLERKKI